MNHLEQLAAEWYEYRGYFLRRNVKVGRRDLGGYDGELDVVAFDPVAEHLVHVEASLDAHSWARRDERFGRKFALGRKHIPALFEGLDLPSDIEQVALLGYASNQNRQTVGGGRLLLVGDLLEEIVAALAPKRFSASAIPETLPLLRTLHLVAEHRTHVVRALAE